MERIPNTSFMPSEEELEKERREVLTELNEVNKEIKHDKKIKLLISTIILISTILIIKLTVGTININNIFGYPKDKARFYEVTLNDTKTSVSYELTHKLPIIPYIVNLNSNYLGGSNYLNDEDGVYFYNDNSEKYILNIKSYSCFKGKYQVECVYDEQIMKENNDTKYTNLEIVRTSNPYEKIYNGKFVKDITKYIKEKGVYYVGITAKHQNTETKVYFYFKNKVN